MHPTVRQRVRARTIAGRIALTWTVLGALALGSATALFLHVRARSGYRLLDADIEHHLLDIADAVRPALLSPDPVTGLQRAASRPLLPFAVRDGFGESVYRSAGFPDLDQAAEHLAQDAVHDRVSFTSVQAVGERPLRLGTLLVGDVGGRELAVQVVAPEDVLHGYGTDAIDWLVGFEVLLLGGFVWVGTIQTRRALAPVSRAAARLCAVDGDIPPAGWSARQADELAGLDASVTRAVETARAARHAAERFVTAASRELQTPLASIRAAAEACLRDDDQGACRRLADDLKGETERLSALVRDLRLLAAAEAGHLVDQPEPLDLALLIAECGDIAGALGEDKQVAVAVTVDAHPIVAGDRATLRRLVLDLAQFAIRCSQATTPVSLRLAATEAEAVVTVTGGRGELGPADLARILEPFADVGPPGPRAGGCSGIGLGVASRIAGAHGGRLTAEGRPGDSLVFTATLPRRVERA